MAWRVRLPNLWKMLLVPIVAIGVAHFSYKYFKPSFWLDRLAEAAVEAGHGGIVCFSEHVEFDWERAWVLPAMANLEDYPDLIGKEWGTGKLSNFATHVSMRESQSIVFTRDRAAIWAGFIQEKVRLHDDVGQYTIRMADDAKDGIVPAQANFTVEAIADPSGIAVYRLTPGAAAGCGEK